MKEYFSFLSNLKGAFYSFVDALKLNDLQVFLKNVGLMLISFLAPITSAILAVYFLIFVDLVTGLWASIKEKQPITSSALSRTIGKILIYSTTIVVSFVVHKYLLGGFELPIEALVSGFIAITETKSIFENLNRLSNNKALGDLILILSNERQKRLPPKNIKSKEQ
jgi:phage-related holin